MNSDPEKFQKRLADKKRAFLAAIAMTASIQQSADAVKINRSNHYDWLKQDPEYPARFAAAMAMGDDALEDEVTARAKIGVFEPNVYQGRFCYPQEEYEVELVPGKPATEAVFGVDAQPAVPPVTETRMRDIPGAMPLGVWKKSDALLMFRQRGRFAKYRQNFTELSGPGGGPVQSEHRIVFVKPGAAPPVHD